MVKSILGFLFGCLFVLFIHGCQESFAPAIEKQVDFEQQELILSVQFYDHIKDLNNVFDDSDNTVEGFANVSWEVDQNGQAINPICNIHSLEVRGVSDYQRMETLGHELLHCIYGLYHDPSIR